MSSPENFTSAYSANEEVLLRELTASTEGTPLPEEIKTAMYEGVTNLMNTLGIPSVTDKQRNVFQKSGGNYTQLTGEQAAFLLQFIALSTEPSRKADAIGEIESF